MNLFENINNEILNKLPEDDPLRLYYENLGVSNTQGVIRFNKQYINIDSRDRVKIQEYELSDNLLVDNNNSQLVENADGTTQMQITSGFQLQADDCFLIKDPTVKPLKLFTLGGEQPLFQFKTGSRFVKVNYPHGLLETQKNRTVTIEGSSIGELNGTHFIFFSDGMENFSPDYFFIQVPKQFDPLPELIQEQITMTLNHIYGVPLEDLENLELNDITIDEEDCLISFPLEGNVNYMGEYSFNLFKVGGAEPSYPNPNNYCVPIGVELTNVISLRIVSSEFPNLNVPTYNINECVDRLMWETAGQLFMITLDYCIYNIEELVAEINTQLVTKNYDMTATLKGKKIIFSSKMVFRFIDDSKNIVNLFYDDIDNVFQKEHSFQYKPIFIPYVYILNDLVQPLSSSGPVKEAYAKIQMEQVLEHINDTFVVNDRFVYDPVPKISEFCVQIVDHRGNPANFGNRDHSFTLEFITMEENPIKSYISARTGN